MAMSSRSLMRSSDKSSVKGLTLIEVMISVLILAITLSAMLGAFVIGKVSMAKAKHRLAVVNLLQQKMEEIEDTSYGSIVSGSESVTIDNAGTPDLSDDDLIGTLQVIVGTEPTTNSYLPVTINLSWTERSLSGSQDLSEELATYFRSK